MVAFITIASFIAYCKIAIINNKKVIVPSLPSPQIFEMNTHKGRHSLKDDSPRIFHPHASVWNNIINVELKVSERVKRLHFFSHPAQEARHS